MKRPGIIHVAAAVATLVVANYGFAGAVVGATEFTQIANNVELAASYTEHVQHTVQQQEMLVNQLNAYRIQLQNVKKLDAANWEGATSALNQLARNVHTADQLGFAVANQDEAFKALHKDYDAFEKAQPANASMSALYKDWSKFNSDAAARAASTAGITLQQAESEDARIRALRAAGATADGQMQAITAGNLLASEMLDQVHILNRMTAVQMDTQSRYQLIEAENANHTTAHDAAVMDDPEESDPKAKEYGAMK